MQVFCGIVESPDKHFSLFSSLSLSLPVPSLGIYIFLTCTTHARRSLGWLFLALTHSPLPVFHLISVGERQHGGNTLISRPPLASTFQISRRLFSPSCRCVPLMRSSVRDKTRKCACRERIKNHNTTKNKKDIALHLSSFHSLCAAAFLLHTLLLFK